MQILRTNKKAHVNGLRQLSNMLEEEGGGRRWEACDTKDTLSHLLVYG